MGAVSGSAKSARGGNMPWVESDRCTEGRSPSPPFSSASFFSFSSVLFVDREGRPEAEKMMMELLKEILFSGAVSFLFALLIARFVSSPFSPADHPRRRRARAEISASVAGSCGGGFVVIEEGTRCEGGSGEILGAEGEIGRRKETVEAPDSDGVVRAEVASGERAERLDFGRADVESVRGRGDGGVAVMGVSLLEEDRVVKDVRLESGGGPEKNGERGLVGDSDDNLNIGSLPMDQKVVEGEAGSRGEFVEEKIEEKQAFPNDDDDDDWEGIERSDVEKLFSVATAFVGSVRGGEALSKLSSELQLELHGLYKIATEGPCYETQPLPLKVSARLKWHAWHKLGNMNPEAAMEQYIALLTDNLSEWREQAIIAEQRKIEEGNDYLGAGRPELQTYVVTTPQHDQQFLEAERKELFC